MGVGITIAATVLRVLVLAPTVAAGFFPFAAAVVFVFVFALALAACFLTPEDAGFLVVDLVAVLVGEAAAAADGVVAQPVSGAGVFGREGAMTMSRADS